MKTELAFLLVLTIGVLGLLFLMQAAVEEEDYDVFNPKASLERRSLTINPSAVAQKKSNGSKDAASFPRVRARSRAGDAILRKPWTSPSKPLDAPSLETTPAATSRDYLRGGQLTAARTDQERRKYFLQSFCKKLKRSRGPPQLDLTEMVSQIYVEEKHKILYCEVPKAGCSNWKRTLMVLGGLAAATDVLSHDAVHYRTPLRKLDSFDRAGIRERLATYTKVLAVRDPAERLVSAFRDKFEQPNAYYHPVYGRAIIRRYRANATEEALRSGSGVTFGEFVRYLLDPDKPLGMDIHWETVNRLCFPCAIAYDFVGKFETLDRDASYLLGLVGAPAGLRFPSFKDRHSSEERTNAALVRRYVDRLPPAERQRMYDFFYLDYLMFNYTRPHFSR